MEMDTVSPKIAQYVARTKYKDLSPGVVSSARRSTLDTLAAMVAGSNAPGVRTVVDLAAGWGGKPEASLMGFGLKLPAPAAAWCNGTMARALEIDDCVDFLPVHPSASAIPALLSLAESRGNISGREFLTALAVGQDLIIRMGLAVRENAMQSGRNNLFKIFGPTAAVARALRLDPEQVQHALGISFSHAVGDAQCALDGALTLRLQQGIVAQGALISGLLAEKGFTGAREFLLGRWGYLNVWEPEPRLEFLTDGLGQNFYSEQISIKPFSSCRATHPSIDLTMTLARKNELNADAISQIKIRTSPEVHNLVAHPPEIKCRPDSVPTAQFSIQYTVAAALLRGDMFLAELSPDLFKDEKINDLSNRIQVDPDTAMRTGSVLGRTWVEIHTKEGAVITGEIEHPLGSPKRPFGFDECGNKLRKCAEYSVSPLTTKQLDLLIDRVGHMEDLEDVSVLVTDLF